MLDVFKFKIHPEGYKFAAIFSSSAIVFLLLPNFLGLFNFFAYILFALSFFTLYFFRDPIRSIPLDDTKIVAPADGLIIKVQKSTLPDDLENDQEFTKISIFMNVFNVHVNRMPYSGEITNTIYYPGKFFNASLDKASKDNERCAYVVENKKYKKKIVFVQIAGLIARRIVNFTNINDSLEKGDKFGLIRFGSRVDIYLPIDCDIHVGEGQTTIAGETCLASFNIKDNKNLNTFIQK